MSYRFGQPDPEGWYYGVSFDRLNEVMRSRTAGPASATSLVRKRRWIRSIICRSPKINEALKERADFITLMRCNSEACQRDKEDTLKSVTEYEEKRESAFSQSLHLSTEGTLSTLASLKDLGVILKNFKHVS